MLADRGALRRGTRSVSLEHNFGVEQHSGEPLAHLFSGAAAAELAGVEDILTKEKLALPKKVHRAVIVGDKVQPSLARVACPR